MTLATNHVPLDTILALNVWFEDQTLEKGQALLADAEGLLLRHTAGICLADQAQTIATLSFAIHDRIRQGFTIKTVHCSTCGTVRKGDPYYAHIAAAALFALPKTARLNDRPSGFG